MLAEATAVLAFAAVEAASVLAPGGGSVALDTVVLMSRDGAAARDGVLVVALARLMSNQSSVGAAGNAVNQLGTLPLRFRSPL